MNILILMTGATTLTLQDDVKYPSGFWAEEFAIPYKLFKERGYDVDVATVRGVVPSVDKSSLDPANLKYVRPAGSRIDDAARAVEWAQIIENAPELKTPLAVEKISQEQLAQYDAVYMAGGHGCLEDEPKSQAMGQLTTWTHDLNIPVAAVCHGHCTMISARDAEGNFPYKGYAMTSFSHNEEKVTPIYGRLSLVLEEELRRLGVIYSEAPLLWDAHVVVDRNLLTGQNPFSSALLTEMLLHKLRESRAKQVS